MLPRSWSANVLAICGGLPGGLRRPRCERRVWPPILLWMLLFLLFLLSLLMLLRLRLLLLWKLLLRPGC